MEQQRWKSVNPVQVSAGVKMLGIPVSNTGYGGVPVQDTRVFQLSSSELAAFECIGDTGCSDVFSKILLNPLELNPQSSASDDVLNLEPCFCKGFQMASIATCIILLNSRWRFTEQKLLRTLPPTLWTFTSLDLRGDSFVHLIPGFREPRNSYSYCRVCDADPDLGFELILDWQSRTRFTFRIHITSESLVSGSARLLEANNWPSGKTISNNLRLLELVFNSRVTCPQMSAALSDFRAFKRNTSCPSNPRHDTMTASPSQANSSCKTWRVTRLT